MCYRGPRFWTLEGILPIAVLLMCATAAAAQHHGGHGIGGASGGISRPDGVDETDSLKDFHHALAVQATSLQIAEFKDWIKSTNAVEDKLHSFSDATGKGAREGISPLDQSVQGARTRNQKFQDGLSESQKSGLREILKRLDKADADLDQETKRLDQVVLSEAPAANVSSHISSLAKTLADFTNVQLALGREMGIALASGQDLVFSLPRVRNLVTIAPRTVAVDVSGLLSQTASDTDQRTFELHSAMDLFDLQQNITEILNAQLASGSCGPRVIVRRATMMAAAPTSSVVLQLHYERWSCMPGMGRTEIAESDGSVEITLIPAVDNSNVLTLKSEFKRIDATGMMANDLRSGDLGDAVRDKVSACVLQVLQAGADFKSTLPGALRNAAKLQTARFEDPSGSGLKMFLQGQVRLSSEQLNVLASQLNQTFSQQGTPSAVPGAASPVQQTK